MSQLKYTLLSGDTINVLGKTLTRIKALKDFGDVSKDELGGYIESEINLDNRLSDENNEGLNCWIYSDGLATPIIFAKAMDRSLVEKDGKMKGSSEIRDNFLITRTGLMLGSSLGIESGILSGGILSDNARMVGNSELSDNGELTGLSKMSIFGKVYGSSVVSGSIEISNNERIF